MKVKAVGTFEWVTADSSIALKKSDIVRTGPGSAAEIRFFDGTVVAVGADSLIMIEASSTDPSSRRAKVGWRVSNGKVEFQVPPRGAAGGEAEISTPDRHRPHRDRRPPAPSPSSSRAKATSACTAGRSRPRPRPGTPSS